jgi:hypothetical protein
MSILTADLEINISELASNMSGTEINLSDRFATQTDISRLQSLEARTFEARSKHKLDELIFPVTIISVDCDFSISDNSLRMPIR